MSLTEVLPTEPVTPTTRAPSARRQAQRQRLQRRQRILNREYPGPLSVEIAFCRPWLNKTRSRGGADDDAPGAGLDRRRGELAAVDALAAQAEEEVALAGRAGVDRRPGRRARPALGDDLGAERRGDLLRVEVHRLAARGARAPRGRPRGRRRGSCGRPRTPGPARGPCRRSPRCRRARRARRRARSRPAGRARTRPRSPSRRRPGLRR